MSSSLVLMLAVVGTQLAPEVPIAPPAPARPIALQQLQIIRGGVRVVLPAPALNPGLNPVIHQDDEQLLRGVDLPTDPAALVDFLRRQKVDAANQPRITELILDLAADEFETRQTATDELIRIGPSAAVALQEALKSSDLEVVRRAEICLKAIDSVAGPTFQEAVVRLLAKKAPSTAVEVLLDVLPNLRGPAIGEVVAEALGRCGVDKGRPVPDLIVALRDRVAVRREVAGEAVARHGDADARKTVAALLNDPDVGVRTRVAMTLLERGEPAALPVMIQLLGSAPLDRAYEIEGSLLTIAREQAPEEGLGKTADSRKKAVSAWEKWYRTIGEKLDLAKVMAEASKPGHLLISTQTLGVVRSKVIELDATGKTVWELDATSYAYSVQKLPRDRVLISEYTTRKVVERTTKGATVWSKDLPTNPIEAVRLPDGNTLIATRQSIIEVDAQGKDVRTIPRVPAGLIYSMTPLRRDEIAVVTSANRFSRINREGKELSSFQLPGRMYSIGGHFAVSPNGNRIAIPIYNNAVVVGGRVVNQPGRVIEFDANGKTIWEAEADRPTSVRRLANGNLVVASRFHANILELDSRGKVVNKYQAPNGARVLDARR